DTYCLITVLPHDKAIAYASSRRFTVNQALGVLEVRDEGALENLQPSLQAIAETAEDRLFGHVSDADLKKLGVDEQILPVVRLLTTEAHLEAMQAMLPDVQHAALLALACGMTVEEAWAEVAQYLPTEMAQDGVDTADIVTAMERTPGQVAFVSSSEELRSILARPFAAWRVFLHPSQRRLARELTFSGPAQVTGGAGTGKTVTALHRAAHLARRSAAPAGDGPPVLLTSFTRNLVESLDIQLPLLLDDDRIRARVEILNVDRLAYRVVSQAHGRNPSVVDHRVLQRMWSAAASEAGLEFTGVFLQHEWEQVILAQDLRTEPGYLACRRAGRGVPLGQAQRSQVWQAAEQVTAQLSASGRWTHIQLANEAARILRDSDRQPYRHIIVDEAQDLHPAQWRLLRAAVPAGPDDIFIAGDPHQRIYDNRVSLTSLGISIRGRSRRLTVNYRTTQEILAWAVPLLGGEPVAGLDDQVDSLIGYRSPSHGRRPEVRGAATRDEELETLIKRIRSWLDSGLEPHAIGVAARSAQLVRRAREALGAAGLTAVSPGTRGQAGAIRVGTMHGMKGLEFRAVAVIGAEDGTVPAPAAVTPASTDKLAHSQDMLRERCVLFVAATRARDYLHVSYTGAPSRFLST
ncbi:MAG: UvrD-helicase domain-containing protein, partial [Streptosporangiaceae bacterium]